MKIPIVGDLKHNTIEKVSMLLIIFGLVLYSIGTLISIYTPIGLSAILAMLGAFLIFVFTVVLIFFWFFKERSE